MSSQGIIQPVIAWGRDCTQQCYLGPREYLEVAKLQPGLRFRGALDQAREGLYLIQLLDRIELIWRKLDPGTRAALKDKLEQAREIIAGLESR